MSPGSCQGGSWQQTAEVLSLAHSRLAPQMAFERRLDEQPRKTPWFPGSRTSVPVEGLWRWSVAEKLAVFLASGTRCTWQPVARGS